MPATKVVGSEDKMFEGIVAFLTLSFLEIILGFDNLVMVAINVSRLPRAEQKKARLIGMLGALGTRIVLLCTLSYIIGLVAPLFTIFGHAVSWRDMILLSGGLFLVKKASTEVYKEVECREEEEHNRKKAVSFTRVIAEIALLDIIFSLDSVITAVGMAKSVGIMIAAVVVAMIVMITFAKVISEFIQEHTSVKVLALSFLVLIGAVLIAEGCGKEIEKGYIYAPMAFATLIIFLELRRHSKAAKRSAQTRHEQELAAKAAVEDLKALAQK